MPRGRLIFPFSVELGLLNTAAVAADPDGPGPLHSGYDDEFREPIIRAAPGSTRGELVRFETVYTFQAQIEDDTEDALEMQASGNSPQSTIGLVFHFADLEARGVVEAVSGKTVIKSPGARLISIRHPTTNELIERYDEEPGFWSTQTKSMGFGLGPNRNLLLVIFQQRMVSVASV